MHVWTRIYLTPTCTCKCQIKSVVFYGSFLQVILASFLKSVTVSRILDMCNVVKIYKVSMCIEDS